MCTMQLTPEAMLLLLLLLSSSDAVNLTGSSEYAVPGTEFTLTCDVPEEANVVEFYRRLEVNIPVGSIQVGSGKCYNTVPSLPVFCTANVCSCVTSGSNLGTVFRWIIQPQTGDQGSVWFCRRTNLNLPNQTLDSDDYTLNLADGPGTSIALSPPDTTYSRTEGDTLPEITCTADCRPGCTFVWTRPDNTNFTVSPVLSLGQLDRSEHGTYTCTARNDVGESTISIDVIILYGPGTSIALSPSDTTYTRTEGDTLPDITCTADCRPDCIFVWIRPDNTNFTVSPVLSLGQLDRSEHGTYRCTARNGVGESTISISIILQYGPGASIALTPTDTTYIRTEGDTLLDITCTADCRPGCTFVWTRPDNTDFTVSPVLSLGQLDRSEHGTYRCTARNVAGESTTSTDVAVLYGPGTSIALSPSNTIYTRIEGDTLPDITCTADCRPDCNFVWTRPDNTNFTVSPVLSLGQLDRSDHGTYRCTARNGVGESNISISIILQYGPRIVTITPSDTSYNVTEGQTIPTITCSADCNPACTYSWTKDGQSYTIGSGLQLTNIQRGQTGVYRCTASNVHGSETTVDINVTVYYLPGTSITLSPPNTTYTRTEGDTLPDITCTADCRPDCTFAWTRPDNTNFTASPVLSLGQLDRSENGTYRCTARNVVGESTILTIVIVQFPPNILDLAFITKDGNITEGSSTSLNCIVESYPPPTIQWFYKVNGTVLLTSPDVLESTYTLTNAACLDTGLYTCSVRNSISTTAVTKDIAINVLCKPRADPRSNVNDEFGLATSDNMTLYAMFLANPEPYFNWTFKNRSWGQYADLVNGTDNFSTQNSFISTNLSAVAVGIRIFLQEHWYGTYNVTATNTQGTGTISFQVDARGNPSPPYEGSAICPFKDRAFLSWKSAFDGGSNQTFVVGTKMENEDIFHIDRTTFTSDPGQYQLSNISVTGLAVGTQHFFIVYAFNAFGNSTMENEVNCTTKVMPVPEESVLGPILGAAGGSVTAVIVVVIIVVVVIVRKGTCRKNNKGDDTEMITNPKKTPDDDSDGLKPNILYESSDGLKANILYETSEPQPGSSSEYAVVLKKSKTTPVSRDAVYAIVDKSKNNNTLESKHDLYADVVKSKGKVGKGGKGKGKQKKKEAKQKDGNGGNTKESNKKVEKANDVYENVDDIQGARGSVYANCGEGEMTLASNGLSRKTNKDGLIYLDIEFKDDNQSGRNYIIHGIENRTDYADVDFTKHADPLPSDSEDCEKIMGAEAHE